MYAAENGAKYRYEYPHCQSGTGGNSFFEPNTDSVNAVGTPLRIARLPGLPSPAPQDADRMQRCLQCEEVKACSSPGLGAASAFPVPRESSTAVQRSLVCYKRSLGARSVTLDRPSTPPSRVCGPRRLARGKLFRTNRATTAPPGSAPPGSQAGCAPLLLQLLSDCDPTDSASEEDCATVTPATSWNRVRSGKLELCASSGRRNKQFSVVFLHLE